MQPDFAQNVLQHYIYKYVKFAGIPRASSLLFQSFFFNFPFYKNNHGTFLIH